MSLCVVRSCIVCPLKANKFFCAPLPQKRLNETCFEKDPMIAAINQSQLLIDFVWEDVPLREVSHWPRSTWASPENEVLDMGIAVAGNIAHYLPVLSMLIQYHEKEY